MSDKKLFLASQRGFCNGVRRALETVEKVLVAHPGKPIYVYNEIVHNNFVVNSLKYRGVNFVTALSELPTDAIVIWSAHGVSPELERQARDLKLHTVDATCPLVKRLHDLAVEHRQAGNEVIVIGHRSHPETEGVLGCGSLYCVSTAEDCADLPEFPPETSIAVLTQTTWCAEEIQPVLNALEKRYTHLVLASNICYATSERQQAVRDLITEQKIELLLVIGSPRSSNSNRLCEVARKQGAAAMLVDDPQELTELKLDEYCTIGLTAGASAPEILVEEAVKILQERFGFILQ